MKILVVEDIPSNWMVINSQLHKLGDLEEVVWIQTMERLRAIQETDFDVVLCDLVIPGTEGDLDALREVVKRWPESAVIVLTGSDEPALAAACIREGATDYVQKGCGSMLKDLPTIVANALRVKRSLEKVTGLVAAGGLHLLLGRC